MRYGLDFVDLENPKVRPPTVRLEERIMIGAEMSRCAPTMNGGVEHATEVGAIDRTTLHAASDQATRELIRAIRGQPNRGLRDLSSTMALMSASLDPFGPGFFGHGLDENSRRYLRRTNA